MVSQVQQEAGICRIGFNFTVGFPSKVNFPLNRFIYLYVILNDNKKWCLSKSLSKDNFVFSSHCH